MAFWRKNIAVVFSTRHGELAAQRPYICNFYTREFFVTLEQLMTIIQVLGGKYLFSCELCAAKKLKYIELETRRSQRREGGYPKNCAPPSTKTLATSNSKREARSARVNLAGVPRLAAAR